LEFYISLKHDAFGALVCRCQQFEASLASVAVPERPGPVVTHVRHCLKAGAVLGGSETTPATSDPGARRGGGRCAGCRQTLGLQ